MNFSTISKYFILFLLALSFGACSNDTGNYKKNWSSEHYKPQKTERDSDQDGVANDQDKCADTRPHTSVDKAGCPFDLDNDTVPDYKDNCPHTPAGAKIDAVGCSLDVDHDGVRDYRDECPFTPRGAYVNSVGCPIDSDNDGVLDYRDQCQDTPRRTVVDSVGCTLDSDGDKVIDRKDRCPNTPKGAQVNLYGCWVLENLYFETDKATIQVGTYGALDHVVTVLKNSPDISINIQGHTDSTGSDAYNLALSQARAQTVLNYLVKKGISAKRLTIQGFGERRPYDSNATPQGRANNRRVELKPMQN